MRLAYLVNQYPQPSQSFIRREIAAIESKGHPVLRYTVRAFDGKLHDPRDAAEAEKTTAVLGRGKVGLILGTLLAAVTQPARFCAALFQTCRYARRSERGLLTNLFYLIEAVWLAKELRSKNITHLHAHFGTNSATVAHLQNMLGGPRFSFTCHGPEEFDRPLEINLADKIAAAYSIVAISQFTRSQLYRWCDRTHWGKIHVVHCGVDDLFLASTPTPVPNVNQLVCVGRLSEQKGQLILIEAAAKLRESIADFRILLAGDGDMRQPIEERIAQLNLGDQIRLLGTQSNDQVRQFILESRAMVLPSFAEGLPVVFMESLALGRPVVTTTVAGIPELVQDGKCGFLVPAGDVDRLADSMNTVLKTPIDQLTSMGEFGATQVKSRHAANTEASKLISLFS
jgi:colanic acid/amylovoran biosynthesis glycosyltransferase